MGRVISVLSFDPVTGVYTTHDAPDPTDATNFVFVPSAPAQERECLINAFETKEAAEQEAKEFTVTLQKIIDAIKPAEMW